VLGDLRQGERLLGHLLARVRDPKLMLLLLPEVEVRDVNLAGRVVGIRESDPIAFKSRGRRRSATEVSWQAPTTD
jgi:hypothetical protein